MKYKKQIFFVIFVFLVFNGSYIAMTWAKNTPTLDDYYQVRLFFDIGTPPPDYFLTVHMYDENNTLMDIATSFYYSAASCYAVAFSIHYTVSNELWSIQNKVFTAFDYGNTSLPLFSFVVESQEWQAGDGDSWAQWFQLIDIDAFPLSIALGPYHPTQIITRWQLADLLQINFLWFFIGISFLLGFTYNTPQNCQKLRIERERKLLAMIETRDKKIAELEEAKT